MAFIFCGKLRKNLIYCHKLMGILMDYISMKKKMNRLTNANIDNIKRQELDVGEVFAQLDSLIKKYPALMDDSTTENCGTA